MKKLLALLFSVLMVLSLTACGSNTNEPTNTDGNEATRVALLLPYVGDQSYFDVTYNGLNLLKEELGDAVEVKLIEMGTDSASWETAHRQAADEGYDVIISGNWQYEGAMLKVAAEYPEIKYLNFDFSSAEANALENVYAITYAANEIGYLAGVVAATKSQTGIVGGVGGMDNDGIKQFMAGYIQGAADVNPEVKVLISYVGDFQDTAKAKEISQNMINKGADVVWGCAGGAGNGVFEAVAENEGVWAIGVDTDQYVSMSGKPELAATILTSGLKNCDVAVCNSVIAMINEEVEYGTNKVLGYDDGAVGLAENDYYLQNMTEEELATVKSFADKVLNGETVVIDELVTPGVYDQYLAQYGLQ